MLTEIMILKYHHSMIIKTDNLDLNELDVFVRLREPQLYHHDEPAPGLFLAEGIPVCERALDAGFQPVSVLAEDRHIDRQFAPLIARLGEEIPIYSVPFEVLKEITGYSLTGGFLCAMRRKEIPSPETVLQNADKIAILERITNPTNIGAIVRSAAALSVDALLFTRDSCDPLCRRAIRVSMGTIFQIPWTVLDMERPGEAVTFVKDFGYETVAMALRDDATELGTQGFSFAGKAALFFGSEGDGLSPETISACDRCVRIPMRPGVDSLNVAAASAVAFWELTR